MNREAQAAVFENPAALILDDGLPYDRCQVGVVTDLGGAQELARHDVRDIDQMVKILRTQIDVVLADGVGVLNANDERIAAMAELCDGEILMYAVADAQGLPRAMVDHLSTGGRAVILRQGRVMLATGATERLGIDLAGMLRRRHRSEDAALAEALMVAVATAWAFGISPELIAAGIETFEIFPAQ
jgi:cyanophycin synthetase